MVLGLGLLIPLMENDSAQHATMAMQMAQTNQFFEIYKGENPYLDKPHMHFWLAALSFKIFGFYPWAYRLPAIVLTLIATFGIYKIALLLYDRKEIGRLSALIFLSSFAIILSLHDVRTDAVLVAFTILASWQWLRYLQNLSLSGAILGGIFAACAYATKGMFAVAVIGMFLFYTVLFQQQWKKLFNYKLLVGILCFIIASLPMFYAYYHQFGWDGIEFITYGQSTGRFKGEDFGTASAHDYFFYFHTILWAMLPWGLWFYFTLYLKGKNWIQKRHYLEWITAATVLTFIIGMNFSSFKLPHYLNIVLPFAAIYTAGGVFWVYENTSNKTIKLYQWAQYITVGVGTLILGVLIYCFPLQNVAIIGLIIFLLGVLVYLMIQSRQIEKPILLSAGFILIASIYLNSTFYPSLISYQANHQLGDYAIENKIPPHKIYNLSKTNTWAMDWKLKHTIPHISTQDLGKIQSPFWAIVYGDNPVDFLGKDYKIIKKFKAPHYRITRLKWKFLDPATRPQTLDYAYIVQVEKK